MTSVGLPLKGVQTQREEFRKYMLQNKHVEFFYRRKKYVVDIEDCTVMQQCYAAIAENLKAFTGMNMVADIGNGTMNIMILNNGKASDSKSWTVKMGANKCSQKIRNLVSARLSKDLQPEIIENYLRFGDTMIGSTYEASFVVVAIIDYYNRCIAVADDPYLETREKEDAFADRISAMVEQKVLSNIPALAGMYLMQQQAIMTARLQSGVTPFVSVMPQMSQPVQMQATVQQEYPKESDQKIANDGFNELDIEENELADVDMF